MTPLEKFEHYAAIAKKNGIRRAVYRIRVRKLGWSEEKAATKPIRKNNQGYQGEYAVYRGDDIVAMGTAEECAKELGIDVDYIKWMTSPAGKRRLSERKNPEKATTAVRLDE